MHHDYTVIYDDAQVENTENKDDVKFPLVGHSRYLQSNTTNDNHRNFKCFNWRKNKSFTRIYILFIIYSILLIAEAVATVTYCSFNLQHNIDSRDYLLDISRIALSQFDIKFGVAIFKLIGTFVAIPTILICNHS